ncbi:MAG: hypothetical protein NTX06_04340 [Proteobacteria bacterium]|nr:hypothetical protein [Pseudomonadota bacterium]
MGDFITRVKNIAGQHAELREMPIDKELSRIRWIFGLLELRLANWQAAGIRKLYTMEMKMRIPAMHQQGITLYPDAETDMPVLTVDLTRMKKKTIAYINVIALYHDDAYRQKHLDAFLPIFDRYKDLPQTDMPTWMQPHRNPCSLFAMTSADCYERYEQCALEYVELYCERLHQCPPLEDEDARKRAAEAQRQFCLELAEKDTTRHILAKVIGRRRADRIFQEVLI